MPSDAYEIDSDPARLDLDIIHGYLSRSYWAEQIPRATVAKSLAHSLCFGVYHGGGQVGFARLVTDYATFAYLADVFILEAHRGQGLSKRLMTAILAHPDVQGLRRWMLVTRDAQGLYGQFGFTTPTQPERLMEITRPGLYKQTETCSR